MKTGVNNSKLNQLGNLRPIVIALMKEQGRDLTTCELCTEPTRGRFDLHHTKYHMATYYDLLIVCRSCNLKSENVGLE